MIKSDATKKQQRNIEGKLQRLHRLAGTKRLPRKKLSKNAARAEDAPPPAEAPVSKPISKAAIREIVDEHGVEELTAKSVREHLERRAGLEPGTLKPEKHRIGELIDAVLAER